MFGEEIVPQAARIAFPSYQYDMKGMKMICFCIYAMVGLRCKDA